VVVEMAVEMVLVVASTIMPGAPLVPMALASLTENAALDGDQATTI